MSAPCTDCARARDGLCYPHEVEALRAEVARLREALQDIADMYPDGPTACGLAEAALRSTSAIPTPEKPR